MVMGWLLVAAMGLLVALFGGAGVLELGRSGSLLMDILCILFLPCGLLLFAVSMRNFFLTASQPGHAELRLGHDRLQLVPGAGGYVLRFLPKEVLKITILRSTVFMKIYPRSLGGFLSVGFPTRLPVRTPGEAEAAEIASRIEAWKRSRA